MQQSISIPSRWILALAAALLVPCAVMAESEVAAAGAEEAANREIVVGDEVVVTAKVVEIDRTARTITIEGPEGLRVPIQAPDPAPNFDQVKLGDEVTIRYYEAVALAIRPAIDAKPSAVAIAAVSTAPPGATPGGLVIETVERTAIVRAIDRENRIVTLDVPAGGLVALDVDESVDLANVKIGEKVIATHTQALAIQITHPE